MDLTRREEYKQKLYELTPADGTGISNASLREKLKGAFPSEEFTLDDYWDIRQALITEGKLERGRGYGGSVHRVLPSIAPPQGTPATATPPVSIPPSEASLYEPFQKCLQNGFVPDNDLKPWASEITAFQGRRDTGGRWTRPDVTLIAMQTFTYVPHKVFEVITFEIKPNIETALDGVFEAAAHSAFAHRSYLAFPDSKNYATNPLFERISDECERFGLGLILFEDVANWDTYSFQVQAKVRQPEPQALNDFIKTQISEKNREEIQRWFR
jgi:hypothetical protein